jgi:hypothetical protein
MDFFDDRAIQGMLPGTAGRGVIRERPFVTELQGLAIGHHNAALLRNAIQTLLDLDKDRAVGGQHGLRLVVPNPQLAPELEALQLLPVAAIVGRIIIELSITHKSLWKGFSLLIAPYIVVTNAQNYRIW